MSDYREKQKCLLDDAFREQGNHDGVNPQENSGEEL